MKNLISIILVCLSLIACQKSEIKDGIVAAEKLIYNQQYGAAESLLKRLLDQIGNTKDEFSVTYRLKILNKLSRINLLHRYDYQAAIKYLEVIISEHPHTEEAYRARSTIAEIYAKKLNQPSQAIVEYQELISLYRKQKDVSRLQYELAHTYFDMKNFEQCRNAAYDLLQEGKDNEYVIQAQLLVANTYYIQEEYHKALDIYLSILDNKSTHFNDGLVAFEVGNAYQILNDLEKALDYYYRALKTHPNPLMVQKRIKYVRYTLLGLQPQNKRRRARPIPSYSQEIFEKEKKVKTASMKHVDLKKEEEQESQEQAAEIIDEEPEVPVNEAPQPDAPINEPEATSP